MSELFLDKETLLVELEKAISRNLSIFWAIRKDSTRIEVWCSSDDYFSEKGAIFVADGRSLEDVDTEAIREHVEFWLSENSAEQENVVLVK